MARDPLALNLTMIEFDPVQTVLLTSPILHPPIPFPLPRSPPAHSFLYEMHSDTRLWLANAAHPPLSLAPINADHSRSDFPARDLDFVPPSVLPAGCCALGGAEGASRRGSPSQLAAIIRQGGDWSEQGHRANTWCSVIMNRNTLPFNVWKLLLNTKQETIEIAFFLVLYHAMYCWHLQLLRHITFLNRRRRNMQRGAAHRGFLYKF